MPGQHLSRRHLSPPVRMREMMFHSSLPVLRSPSGPSLGCRQPNSAPSVLVTRFSLLFQVPSPTFLSRYICKLIGDLVSINTAFRDHSLPFALFRSRLGCDPLPLGGPRIPVSLTRWRECRLRTSRGLHPRIANPELHRHIYAL